MDSRHKHLVTEFIEKIWNKSHFQLLDSFLHPDFQDHSLIPALPPDKQGLITWIQSTSTAFDHTTVIENMVSEENHVMLKLYMHLQHIGTWRNIEPTGAKIQISGFRHFQVKENKILAHWALLDGNSLENQLRDVSHGCTL
ncbi:ester cyclase [Rufibacter sp. LB8]|uniref:ester cyclase n=1 Tax=Rufibacter sp. LB8 TaxID=2777781 RepID=UPI00178C5BE0|nr:ester cyclase [Rufibacter sp. LB8]